MELRKENEEHDHNLMIITFVQLKSLFLDLNYSDQFVCQQKS